MEESPEKRNKTIQSALLYEKHAVRAGSCTPLARLAGSHHPSGGCFCITVQLGVRYSSLMLALDISEELLRLSTNQDGVGSEVWI